MDEQQALQFFFEQFGTAYEESNVPDDADLKQGYITYQKMLSSMGEPVYPSARIWTRSSSWQKADSMLNTINDRLKNGGQIIKINNGRMWIERGSPFAQTVAEEDRTIRSYLLNFAVEFLTE